MKRIVYTLCGALCAASVAAGAAAAAPAALPVPVSLAGSTTTQVIPSADAGREPDRHDAHAIGRSPRPAVVGRSDDDDGSRHGVSGLGSLTLASVLWVIPWSGDTEGPVLLQRLARLGELSRPGL